MTRVMVVDDEEDVVEILRLALEDEGYEVSVARGGEECLQKLGVVKPEVVLLDIMLPGVTGLDVLKRIKERHPDIAVIMITAYASLDSAIEAMSFGASHYLTKPLNFYDLKLIVRSVLEKRRLELEVKKTKDFLKGIIESSPDSIITTDLEGRITSFNRGAEEIFGYKAGEVLGRSILDFYPPMLRATREKWIEELKKGGAVRNKRIRLYGKKKRPVDLSLSAALLRGAGEAPAGVVEIGRDISGEVKAEEEMMRKFLKYKIELGNVYLVKERKPEKAVDVFLDMVSCGYKGAVISRDHLEEVKKSSFDVKFLWLAEREYSNAIYPAPRAILRAMEELLAMNKTILLDRLDYLIARQGFKNVLRLVQELRELFYVERGVLIISLDPGTLHGRELRLLEKETREVKLRKAPAFPEDLRELLRFVYQQNKLGVKPPYKEVAKKLGVTRTTARRKIRELRAKGLLTEAKKGRFKVLEITPEGLEYF